MKLASIVRALTLHALFLVSLSSYAGASADNAYQINSACLKQAVSLANQLKSEIYTEMDSIQSDKIIKLATSTCKHQFNQAETSKAIVANNTDKEAVENTSGNSILDTIFSGDTTRKKGNERLKNLKR